MKKLGVVLLGLFLVGTSSCVPKKEFDKQKNETDSCYDALRKENARKKELATALDDLKKKLQDVADERARLAEAKGELEGNLANLEQAVTDQLGKIDSLTEEKSKLAAEKEKLEAERAALAAKTETYDELVGSLKREMEEKLIEVKQQGQRITVNVSDQILFDSGSTAIKEQGQGALEKIAGILAKVDDKRIDVEGHTDNVPITGKLAAKYPSNWELSAARATNVVRFLEDKGVNPARMAAVGKSEFRPVTKNDTPEGRRQNRRIEIVLTPWDQDTKSM